MIESLRGFRIRNLSLNRLLGTPTGARFARQALVVLATLFLAYNLGKNPSWTYVWLPIALAIVWLVYNYPELGILALLLAALMVPFEIGTGTGSPLNAAFLMVPGLGGLWLVQMARNRSIRMAQSITTLPLVGLIVTASISLLVGYLPWNVFAQMAPLRAQLGAWAIFVFSAGAFWLAGNRIRDVRWLERLVWIFVVLAAVYILGRVVGGSIDKWFNASAIGSLFWIWLVVLAAGQVLFNRDLAPHWRLALVGLIGVTFVVALTGDARNWASGWVPPLVGLGVLIGFRWPRFTLLAGFAGVLIALLDVPKVQQIIVAYKSYDLLTRGAALTIVLEIVKANPLLGVGPANYYYYTPLYPILGYYVRFNSHNNYIDILAQTGLLGMFFFTWFAVATARLGWSLRNRVKGGFARAYVYSCLAGLVACLIASALGDWFLPFVYNIGINGFRTSVMGWLFLGGLVALDQITKQQASAEASPSV